VPGASVAVIASFPADSERRFAAPFRVAVSILSRPSTTEGSSALGGRQRTEAPATVTTAMGGGHGREL